MAQVTAMWGREDGIAALTDQQLLVWNTYQDFLACLDTTIVPPPEAAKVACQLAAVFIAGTGIANLPGFKPPVTE